MNNQLKPSKVLGRGDVSLKHENYGLLCQKFAMKHSQKKSKTLQSSRASKKVDFTFTSFLLLQSVFSSTWY